LSQRFGQIGMAKKSIVIFVTIVEEFQKRWIKDLLGHGLSVLFPT